MNQNLKWRVALVAALALVLAAGSAPAGSHAAAAAPPATVLIAAEPGALAAVEAGVRAGGGAVRAVLPETGLLIASLPASRVMALWRVPGVRAVAQNGPVRLDPAEMKPLADTAGGPAVAAGAVGDSLRLTAGQIGADTFWQTQDSRGEGVLVAVLDTGVDPGHPDLQTTPDGRRKLLDWRDFTGEGDVTLDEISRDMLPGIVSQSGAYRLGAFAEAQVPPSADLQQDLNRNGSAADVYRVLATDTAAPGVYDTVYIDLNGDGVFGPDEAFRPFGEGGKAGRFGGGDELGSGVSFVVTELAADGSRLNLGFDGGLHGTHVAGIVAASGQIAGVAPGAQILAVKVMTTGGSGDWAGIARGMEYAVSQGADVVNLSLGALPELNDGRDAQSLLIDQAVARHGVTVIIAAGNDGPGLNTVGSPGTAAGAVTVGAYVHPDSYAADYGLPGVPTEGLWYFSSAGPRADGGYKPDVVAPGSARSTVPHWAPADPETPGYAVFQGTSMAAPQTAGAAALLLSAARRDGVPHTPGQISRALALSARPLDGYQVLEQGHGLIQVDKAYATLGRLAAEAIEPVLALVRDGRTTGVYARDEVPQWAEWWLLRNPAARWRHVLLSSSADWLEAPAQAMLPSLAAQLLPVRVQAPSAPGVHSGVLSAREPGRLVPAAELLATVVVPYELDAGNDFAVTGLAGELEAAKVARYFFRVPAGAAALDLQLAVPAGADGRLQGRVRLTVTSPSGLPFGPGTGYAGDGDNGGPNVSYTVPQPAAGVWEVDVYASHGAGMMGWPVSKYRLDARAAGVFAAPGSIRLTAQGPAELHGLVAFRNFLAPFEGAATGTALVRPNIERLLLAPGEQQVHMLDVPDGAAALRVSLQPAGQTDASLSLGLFYFDERQQQWLQVATGGREATVLRAQPAPGQYAVLISGSNVPEGGVTAMLSTAVAPLAAAPGAPQVQVADWPQARAFGARWTVPVSIRKGRGGEELFGAVLVVDSQGAVLGLAPVATVSPGGASQ